MAGLHVPRLAEAAIAATVVAVVVAVIAARIGGVDLVIWPGVSFLAVFLISLWRTRPIASAPRITRTRRRAAR